MMDLENVSIPWEEWWYLPSRVYKTTHRSMYAIHAIVKVSGRDTPYYAIRKVVLTRVGAPPPPAMN